MQGLGYLGRFRPFPRVIPDLWSGINRPRGGEDILGTASCGLLAEVGWGLGSRGHRGGEAGSPSLRADGLAGECASRGGRPAPSHLQGQEAGGVSGGGGGGEGLL